MCRILVVKGKNISIQNHLQQFAKVAKHSKEYQGHGWGCGWLDRGQWKIYKSLKPIWKESLKRFGTTRLLVAHARSAFQNKGIVIENNMPFTDGTSIFVFNGELRGVTIKEEGRIGAEKVFNLVRRLGISVDGIMKANTVLKRNAHYIRALNYIIADKNKIYVNSLYNEDPDYFALRLKEGKEFVLCSEGYKDSHNWETLANGAVKVL